MVFETTKQSMAWMEHALQTSLKRNALSMEDKMAAGDLGCATNYGWENFRRTVCIHEALVQQKKRKTITTCTNHSVYYTLFYLHYEKFQSKLGLTRVLTTAFVSFSWKTGGIRIFSTWPNTKISFDVKWYMILIGCTVYCLFSLASESYEFYPRVMFCRKLLMYNKRRYHLMISHHSFI